jgi:hypothetical protein
MLPFISIVPPTRNTTILGPDASQAALKLPEPSAFRLVTSMIRPPRPPTDSAPPPSAPGKAGTDEYTDEYTDEQAVDIMPRIIRARFSIEEVFFNICCFPFM